MFVPQKQSGKNHPKTPGAPNRAQKTFQAMPTREHIARRAYEIYLAGGSVSGHDQRDWFRAERELFIPSN
jgi:hypothetical protein